MSQIVSLKDVLNCMTQRCPKVNHSKIPQSGSLKDVPNCITQRCPKLDHFSLMYHHSKMSKIGYSMVFQQRFLHFSKLI